MAEGPWEFSPSARYAEEGEHKQSKAGGDDHCVHEECDEDGPDRTPVVTAGHVPDAECRTCKRDRCKHNEDEIVTRLAVDVTPHTEPRASDG